MARNVVIAEEFGHNRYFVSMKVAVLTISLTLSAFAFTASAAVTIDINTDVPGGPPVNSVPWSASGTAQDGTGFTFSAGGTNLSTAGYSNLNGARVTGNSQGSAAVVTGYLELEFDQPVENLTFQLASFGSRVVNYGANNDSMSNGTQIFTFSAWNDADAVDVALSNVTTLGTLISLDDDGLSLRGTAGIFDAAGAATLGGSAERGASFQINGPVTRVRFDFNSTTGAGGFLIGDTVEFGGVSFTAVPEPSVPLLGLGAAGLLLTRRRRR